MNESISPHSGSADYFHRLSLSLEKAQEHFQITGDSRIIENALNEFNAAWGNEQLGELNPLVKAQLLNGAGMLLHSRFQITGQLADLDAAITYFNQALSFLKNLPKAHASALSNLSSTLQLRFSHTGEKADIYQSVEMARMAVEASAQKTERSSYLSSLASALHGRYLFDGNPEDLNESIASMRESVELTANGSSRRYLRLNNLAALCQERFSRTGELSNLYEAVDYYRQALAIMPNSSPERPALLNNLGSCLHDLYRRTGVREHLDEGIELLGEACQNNSTSLPNQAGFLSNLGTALVTLYQSSRQLNVLEKAIVVQRKAVQLAGENSPFIPSFLTGLGTSLIEYHIHTKESSLADEAVQVCQAALDFTHSDSPKWPSRCNNLARALMERYRSCNIITDLVAGQEKYRDACLKGKEIQSEIVLVAGYQWGLWALERSMWAEASQALDYANSAIQDLFERQLFRDEQANWLKDAQVLPGLQAYAEIKQGHLQQAVEILENGRARFFFQALRKKDQLVKSTDSKNEENFRIYQNAISELELLQNQPSTYTPAILERVRRLRSQQHRIYQDIRNDLSGDEIPTEIYWETLNQFWQEQANLDVGIYLIPSAYKSFALCVSSEGIDVIWLDFSNSELDLILLGSSDHPEKGFLGAVMGFFDVAEGLERTIPWCCEYIAQPIAEYLLVHDFHRIVIIPTGNLGLLPIHATSPRVDGQVHDWINLFVTSYAPSLYALRYAWLQNQKIDVTPDHTFFSGVAAIGDRYPLKFAEAEAQSIAQLFKKASIINGKADVADILRTMEQASHIHFACHAAFDPIHPWESAFILEHGNLLRIRDIFSLALDGKRLAVLSACKTAVTEFTRIPEEAIGMPIAFLQAGIPGVVGTLWPVNDISTALLMYRFYQNLLSENLPESSSASRYQQSLQDAQNWLRSLTATDIDNLVAQMFPSLRGYAHLRKSKTFEHPYYWAGFVFVGV